MMTSKGNNEFCGLMLGYNLNGKSLSHRAFIVLKDMNATKPQIEHSVWVLFYIWKRLKNKR